MNPIYLFPAKFKLPAQVLFGIVLFPIVYCEVMHIDWQLPFLNGSPFWQKHPRTVGNFTDEIVSTLLIISLWVMGFSKLPVEDEQTASLRLNALYWGVLVYHVLLLIEIWLMYDFVFLGVSFYNILFSLVLYNIRFEYLVNQQKASLKNEE